MSPSQRRRISLAALVAFAGMAAPSLAADATYRVVAQSGGFAPGGGFYSAFERPRISANGRVAFSGRVVGALHASRVWSEGVAGMNHLALVAREGDAIPGTPSTEFGTLSPGEVVLILNAQGDLAMRAPITGTQAQFGDHCVVRHDAQGIEALAMPGQLVSLPCGGFGCQRWLTNIGGPAFNAAGEVAFKTQIDGTGVNASNNTLYLRTDGGAFDVFLREGDAAPNTIGVVFSDAWFQSAQLNDNGEVALATYLAGNGDTYWSVFRGAPGALSIVVAESWSAPTGGEFLAGLFGVGELGFNNAGHTAFHQLVPNDEGDDRTGLWIRRDGGVEAICYEGIAAPNGIPYTGPQGTSAAVNGAGDVVFTAWLGAPANVNNNDVIVRHRQDGTSHIIAREGAQAPGLPAGALYGPLSPLVSVIPDGRVLFHANLTGTGVNVSNNQSLWITRIGATPALLIREGQSISVGGVARTVETFEVSTGLGWETGHPPAVSHLGQVAMRVEFTDGSDAIVVASPRAVCPGDVNGDGAVDFSDLNAVLGGFGHEGDVVVGDLDLDGDVDFADLNATLGNFGAQCPL